MDLGNIMHAMTAPVFLLLLVHLYCTLRENTDLLLLFVSLDVWHHIFNIMEIKATRNKLQFNLRHPQWYKQDFTGTLCLTPQRIMWDFLFINCASRRDECVLGEPLTISIIHKPNNESILIANMSSHITTFHCCFSDRECCL